MRIIYNISEPQVKSIVKMENKTFSIDAQTFYIPYAGNLDSIKEAHAIRFYIFRMIGMLLFHSSYNGTLTLG